MSEKKNLLLIDDHALIRSGIKSLVEKPGWVVHEASSGSEGLKKVAELHPNIVILDISLPDIPGDQVLKTIRKNETDIKVIILSMHIDSDYIDRCMEAGANGYVVKSDSASDIVSAIEEVMKGRSYISRKAQQVMVDRMMAPYQNKGKNKALTKREYEVLGLIKRGLSNSEIADKLILSRRTIETHRGNIMEKLGVKNVVELIRKTT
jgi:DNA-binding NarL/FixJ family response regulator